MWNWLNNLNQRTKSLGNRVKQWNGNYVPLRDAKDPRDILTTGNKFGDIGLGVLGGLAQANNRQQEIYPLYNYAGNGLARSAFVPMNNPFYIDSTSAVRQIAGNLAKLRRNKYNPATNPDYRLNTTGGDFNTAGRLESYNPLDIEDRWLYT